MDARSDSLKVSTNYRTKRGSAGSISATWLLTSKDGPGATALGAVVLGVF